MNKTFTNLAYINLMIKPYKPLYVFIILLVSSICSNLYAQPYTRLKQINSYSNDADVSGSLISDGIHHYLIGSFTKGLCLPNDTIWSYGYNDMYVVKYDSLGNEIWIKKLGGYNPVPDPRTNRSATFESIDGVYNQECNCIYLTGVYRGSLGFSEGLILEPASWENIFIARMDLEGNFDWAYRIDTCSKNGDINTYRNPWIYNHSDNGLYISGEVGDTTFISGEEIYKGHFVSHFDSMGNSVFTKYISAKSYGGIQVCHEINNDFYMYGNFGKDSFKVANAMLSLRGEQDFYIAKFNSEGELKKINNYGLSGVNFIHSLAVDSSLNIYITGSFHDSIRFDNQTIYDPGIDLFFAKLDSSGSLIWVKQMQSEGDSKYYSRWSTITIAPDQKIYLGGMFSGNAWFDDFYVSTEKNSDWFLARYTPDGNCKGVIHSGWGYFSSMSIDLSGKLNFCGSFSGSMSMGDSVLTSNNQIYDLFIASIDTSFTFYGAAFRNQTNQLIIITNPNQGACTIMLPDEIQDSEKLQLKIFNSKGQVILDQQYNTHTNEIQIDIQSEASGIYPVTITDSKKVYHGKIIFQ